MTGGFGGGAGSLSDLATMGGFDSRVGALSDLATIGGLGSGIGALSERATIGGFGSGAPASPAFGGGAWALTSVAGCGRSGGMGICRPAATGSMSG
jgi:hypothetical protein